MKKVLQGLIAAAALASAPAIAADMPVKSYSPPPPVYTWTGCYVGAGFGYKMWNREHDVYDPAGAVNNQNGTAGGRGWLVTGQLGCDYQVASAWVIGAFIDGDWARAKGDYNERISGLAVSQTGNLNGRSVAASATASCPRC